MVRDQLGLSVSDMRIGVTPPSSMVLLNAAPLPFLPTKHQFWKFSTFHNHIIRYSPSARIFRFHRERTEKSRVRFPVPENRRPCFLLSICCNVQWKTDELGVLKLFGNFFDLQTSVVSIFRILRHLLALHRKVHTLGLLLHTLWFLFCIRWCCTCSLACLAFSAKREAWPPP